MNSERKMKPLMKVGILLQRRIVMFARLQILFLFLGLPPALAQTNLPASVAQKDTDIRMDCIQHRRSICGKVLKILPDGLVVDSGYTNLMRPPLNRSWVVPGNVISQRATYLVEGDQPESVCVGLVFLTDLPKKPIPKVFDYVNLVGFPAGNYTYTSVGDVHRTVRRFSTKLAKSIQWKMDKAEKLSEPLK
jgi:hypothetical protein